MSLYETYGINPKLLETGYDIEPVLHRDHDIQKIKDLLIGTGATFITGDFGMGKTTLMNHIAKKELPKYRVIMETCQDELTRAQIKNKIENKPKRFGLIPDNRPTIFILDDAQTLDKHQDLLAYISLLAEKRSICHNVVLVGLSYNEIIKGYGEYYSAITKLGKMEHKLEPYTPQQTHDILMERIKKFKTNPLSQPALEEIIKQSQNNPRIALQNIKNILNQYHETHTQPQSITLDLIIQYYKNTTPTINNKPTKHKTYTPQPQNITPDQEKQTLQNALQNTSLWPVFNHLIQTPHTPQTYQDIITATKLKKGQISSALSRLELKGSQKDQQALKNKGITQPIIQRTKTGKTTHISLNDHLQHIYTRQ